MSWPPAHLSRESELTGEDAELLISGGVLFFEGLLLQANHTLICQPRFYATVSSAATGKHSGASAQSCSTLADTSLALGGQSLEQPSMAQCFGTLPGTITLNRYINATSGPRHPEPLSKYEIQPRATDALLVLQRLYYLMKNGWVKDVSLKEHPPDLIEILICTGFRSSWQRTSCSHSLSMTLYGRKKHRRTC